MSNFGFTDLRLVKPYEVAFKDARSAVRAHYILENAQVFDSLAPAIADCTLVVGTTSVGHRELHVPLYRLEAAAHIIREHAKQSDVALLFGSEKFGLSNDEMSRCHWLLRIPTRNEHGSMNLGQAVAICLYELRRSATEELPPAAALPSATAEDYERMTGLLLDILRRSGYINQLTSSSAELKLRRLVQRLPLPSGDAEIWLGILRQILWKLKQGQRE